MVLMEFNMLLFGMVVFVFILLDMVSDKDVSFEDVVGERVLVVMFFCNYCFYVIYVNEEIVWFVEDYELKGVGFVGISLNDVVNYL